MGAVSDAADSGVVRAGTSRHHPACGHATLALGLLLPAASLTAEEFHGKVVGIHRRRHDPCPPRGRVVPIRLHGINAPDEGQAFGTRAKQFTSSLAFAKMVTVGVKDRDRYGRLVADVILPNQETLDDARATCA